MKYFDYAATCPLDGEAADAFVKASVEYFGNSSSLHDIGSQANGLLENCRAEFARMLGVNEEGIYFTSGGTEGNFLSIHALLSSPLKKGKHIITGIAEHTSIQSALERLKQDGYEVTYLPFGPNGSIELEKVREAIREDTVLISIQHGNPEIGTLQPIQEISAICKENDILFHTDCVHTFGKIDLTNIAQSVDSLAFSAHKFYGPKGVGAVYIHPRLGWNAFYPGSVHEKGFRPGTVNVPAVASMTVAAGKGIRSLEANMDHYKQLRQAFLDALDPVKSECIIYNFEDSIQLPSTVGLRIKGLEGQFIMLECNRYGYAISTGSACQTGMQSLSKTMTALGITGKSAKEFVRISFGLNTSAEDAKKLGETIVKIIHEAFRK